MRQRALLESYKDVDPPPIRLHKAGLLQLTWFGYMHSFEPCSLIINSFNIGNLSFVSQ